MLVLVDHLLQREQFTTYQDYFTNLLSVVTSFFSSAGWGLAIGTGRLNGNPDRVGVVVDAASDAAEDEDDMMMPVDAVTTIKVMMEDRYRSSTSAF